MQEHLLSNCSWYMTFSEQVTLSWVPVYMAFTLQVHRRAKLQLKVDSKAAVGASFKSKNKNPSSNRFI